MFVQVLLGQAGHRFGAPCHLVDGIESQAVQPPDHRGRIAKVGKLPVECRCRKCNGIPEPLGISQMVHHSGFGMVRTDVDALAAVDAQLPENVRLAIMDADCSSGAALDAVGAAHTESTVQFY